MTRYKLVNGVKLPYTAEEEAARDAAEAAAEADIAANGYKRVRQEKYPSLPEQLDLLFHAIDADADLRSKFSGFYNSIKAVKDANPKP